MKTFLLSAAAIVTLTAAAPGQIVINEIRIDDSGSDNFEYAELYNPGATAVSLDGLTYLVIGDGATGSGTIEDVIALSAASLPAGGYHVFSNQSVLRIDSDSDGTADITAIADQNTLLQFENSDNVTHLLVTGFTGADNDDLDTDDDGVLDVTPWTSVVDAIGLVETPAGGEQFYGAALGFEDIGPSGTFVPAHAYRSPDGGGWNIGAFGSEIESPAGSGNFLLQGTQDTPTVTNPDVIPLTLTILPGSVAENAAFPAATGTVSRPGTTGDLEVTITGNDDTEAIAPVSVFIVDGQSSADFDIEAVDDLFPDGTQTVTFEASAAAATSDTATLDVTDDGGDTFSLVINEVHAVPDASTGDVNLDGTVNNDDEFVEIVNVSANPVDLSGFTLRDQFNLTHVFRGGTRLDPGCALLVFSGPGSLTPGSTSAFGTAEVQIASEGTTLRLSNGGDRVRLLDDFGAEVYSLTYGDLTGTEADGSVALTTDKDGSSGYGRHGTIAGASGSFSPGFFLDGTTPFCTLTQGLTVTVTPGSFAEDAGTFAGTATVTIPAALNDDLLVFLESDDSGEAVPQFAGVFILQGETSAEIPLDAVDDAVVDGTQTVTLSASSSGYLNATATVDVTDAGDVPAFTGLVINEVDADQPLPGSDSAEFIELYNLTGNDESLAGLVLVLINGNGDTVYNAFDLSSQTIPANGFLVIGSENVPGAWTPPGFPATNAIQNGPDAVVLYEGSASDFVTSGADATTLASITNPVVDALVYGTGSDPDDPELIAAFGPQLSEGVDQNPDSLSRVPDGSGSFVAQDPTPGAANAVAPGGPPHILFAIPDFGGGTVNMSIANLSPGTTYSLASTTDLTETIPFAEILTFDPGVNGFEDPVGSGIYIFDFLDASISGKPRNFYQVTGP